MADKLFDKIWGSLKEFEKEHTKTRNEFIFDLFHNYGIPLLKTYFSEAETFDCQTDENGIAIQIIIPELVMLPDQEKELLELFRLTSTCFIKPVDGNKLCIELWIRGWLWQKSDCCNDINRLQ